MPVGPGRGEAGSVCLQRTRSRRSALPPGAGSSAASSTTASDACDRPAVGLGRCGAVRPRAGRAGSRHRIVLHTEPPASAPRTPRRGAGGRDRGPRGGARAGHGADPASTRPLDRPPLRKTRATQSRRAARGVLAAEARTCDAIDGSIGRRSAQRGLVRRRAVGAGRSEPCRRKRSRRSGRFARTREAGSKVVRGGSAVVGSSDAPSGGTPKQGASAGGGKECHPARPFGRFDRALRPPAAERVAGPKAVANGGARWAMARTGLRPPVAGREPRVARGRPARIGVGKRRTGHRGVASRPGTPDRHRPLCFLRAAAGEVPRWTRGVSGPDGASGRGSAAPSAHHRFLRGLPVRNGPGPGSAAGNDGGAAGARRAWTPGACSHPVSLRSDPAVAERASGPRSGFEASRRDPAGGLGEASEGSRAPTRSAPERRGLGQVSRFGTGAARVRHAEPNPGKHARVPRARRDPAQGGRRRGSPRPRSKPVRREPRDFTVRGAPNAPAARSCPAARRACRPRPEDPTPHEARAAGASQPGHRGRQRAGSGASRAASGRRRRVVRDVGRGPGSAARALSRDRPLLPRSARRVRPAAPPPAGGR